jgi:16S rRNA (cytosine1402-N4)-methyltransferase
MAPQNTPWRHQTVLLHEAVDALVHRPDGCYLDGTFGRGGHARLILSQLAPTGRLLGLDRDPEAVAHALQGPEAITDARFQIVHTRFADMARVLDELPPGSPFAAGLDGVLLDLGVSSPQIDDASRGFSFRHDGPLDMRMDPTRGISAADFLASAEERQIAQVIRDYGEERFAAGVAKALVARREAGQPLLTTSDLAQVVARAVKTRERGQDPATRTFQALRIHVNAELEELEQGLGAALAHLKPGGRLAVISFHSLEDRIVKTFIARHGLGEVDRRVPMAEPRAALLEPLARLRPSEAEIEANPRSRSATLRVAQRTDAPLVPVQAAGSSRDRVRTARRRPA